MPSMKSILGIALAVALALGQVAQVSAAPVQDPTGDPLSGEIVSITSEGTGTEALIIVEYKDAEGYYHTVSLTLEEAETLGLVTVNPVTGELESIVAGPGDPIDLTGAEFTEVNACEGTAHPVAGALCGVFFPSMGVGGEMITGWHADGYGFGVIAQALFMAKQLDGDTAMAELILQAKKEGNYGGFGEEYVEITNWGQFKKAVTSGEDKSMTNLGAVMSGRIEAPVIATATTEPTITTSTNTTLLTDLRGKGHGKGGHHGRGGEHGKGKGH